MFARLFALLCAVILWPLAANADELKPGDFGYKHSEHHHTYQQIGRTRVAELPSDLSEQELRGAYEKIFTTGKCHCAAGECRPTEYRANRNAKSGFDVKIDGAWCEVPMKAWLPNEKVPAELLVDPAHVCAEKAPQNQACPPPDNIECVIISSSY